MSLERWNVCWQEKKPIGSHLMSQLGSLAGGALQLPRLSTPASCRYEATGTCGCAVSCGRYGRARCLLPTRLGRLCRWMQPSGCAQSDVYQITCFEPIWSWTHRVDPESAITGGTCVKVPLFVGISRYCTAPQLAAAAVMEGTRAKYPILRTPDQNCQDRQTPCLVVPSVYCHCHMHHPRPRLNASSSPSSMAMPSMLH